MPPHYRQRSGPKRPGAPRAPRVAPQAASSPNGARHIGKGYGLVCRQKREDVYPVYALVKANQAELPVRSQGETLRVSTSGYYDWLERSPSARAQANVTLLQSIRDAHLASDETYGMPRLRAELAASGITASRKRIARLMHDNHLQGVSRRRSWCVTTERNRRQRPAPDLVNRQFVASDINQLWVADMTYVPTWEGFLYLAAVTDVFSRKVVGWAFGVQMTSDLVIAALDMALFTRKPRSVIHHSNQGSQGGFNRSTQQVGCPCLSERLTRRRAACETTPCATRPGYLWPAYLSACSSPRPDG